MRHLEVEQVGEMAYLTTYVAIYVSLQGKGAVLYSQKVLLPGGLSTQQEGSEMR